MMSEARAAELLAALSTLVRTSRAVATKMHGSSITGTQVGALKTLAAGELRMGDLAERLLVAPSVASRVIATLEGDGLVQRHPDPADARACLLGLTELGRARLAERQQYSLQLIRDVLTDWTDEEAAAATTSMARLDARIPVFTERMLDEPLTASTEPERAETAPPAEPAEPAEPADPYGRRPLTQMSRTSPQPGAESPHAHEMEKVS